MAASLRRFRRGAPIDGCHLARVYQLEGDGTDVTVYHEFATTQAAQSFAANPRLKEVMANAGVQGVPTIWITQRT